MEDIKEKNAFLDKMKGKHATKEKDADSLKATDQGMGHVFGEIDAFPTKLHIVGTVGDDSVKKPAPRANKLQADGGKDIEIPRAPLPEIKIGK